jgi:hypothetical protein
MSTQCYDWDLNLETKSKSERLEAKGDTKWQAQLEREQL